MGLAGGVGKLGLITIGSRISFLMVMVLGLKQDLFGLEILEGLLLRGILEVVVKI